MENTPFNMGILFSSTLKISNLITKTVTTATLVYQIEVQARLLILVKNSQISHLHAIYFTLLYACSFIWSCTFIWYTRVSNSRIDSLTLNF